MQIGYSEQEIARMYFGKWCDLFDEFKNFHNFEAQKGIFQERKVVSLLEF